MRKRSAFLETISNLLLFFLFACCMLMVLMVGTKTYKSISAVKEGPFSVSTCTSYVTAKIRHYDKGDATFVGKVGEADAILLKEKIQEETYVTYLYCFDGYLKELFCTESMKVNPEDGQNILPLDHFTCAMEDGLLSFSCEADDLKTETVVFTQSKKGAFS